ncbi:hypothetical protein HN011_007909 [Eciton burchellii]|nr:hypothetical protein HN011_007909 [Eciton burchellii]
MDPDRHFRYCQRTSERNSCSSTHDDALTLLSPSVVNGSQRKLAEAQRALRESRTLIADRVCKYARALSAPRRDYGWMLHVSSGMQCIYARIHRGLAWQHPSHDIDKQNAEERADVNRIKSCYRCKSDLSKLILGRTLKVRTSFVSVRYSPPHLRHPELLSVMA